MKCVVIDDEPMAIDILVDYIEKVPWLNLLKTFRDGFKSLDYLAENDVDLIFLDINMPDVSGLQMLRALQKPPMVIFTTAHSRYAAESYEYNAMDYLVKPIEFDRFLKAVEKAKTQWRLATQIDERSAQGASTEDRKGKILLIKSGHEIHPVDLDGVYYVKAAKNYAIFVTSSKEVMVLMPLKQVLAQLPQDRFFRVHKSYIVHLHQTDVIKKDTVVIKGKIIPIGESYREAFFQWIASIDVSRLPDS